MSALLEIDRVEVSFALRAGWFGRVRRRAYAVRGVSLSIAAGETLALVGESGCGKSTLGRAVLGLVPVTGGSVRFDGVALTSLSASALRAMRPQMQLVFQDPMSALNPRMNVRTIVGEALLAHGLCTPAELGARVAATLERVGLAPEHMERYPHEFSGGQRQRIGIARALALGPRLLVCDEAVSALDVSIQAQILNLLADLKRRDGIAYLFISHDLNVVRHLADRVAVMYLGQLMEEGPAAALFDAPAHPYTRALVAANPVADPDAEAVEVVLEGEVPPVTDPPAGCPFHTRCADVMPRCAREAPPATTLAGGATVRCHLY